MSTDHVNSEVVMHLSIMKDGEVKHHLIPGFAELTI